MKKGGKDLWTFRSLNFFNILIFQLVAYKYFGFSSLANGAVKKALPFTPNTNEVSAETFFSINNILSLITVCMYFLQFCRSICMSHSRFSISTIHLESGRCKSFVLELSLFLQLHRS